MSGQDATADERSCLLVYYVQSPYITEPECTNTQYKKFSPTTLIK